MGYLGSAAMSVETERGIAQWWEDMEKSQKHVKLWLSMAVCTLSYGSSYPTNYICCHHPKITLGKNCSLLGPPVYSVAKAEIRTE